MYRSSSKRLEKLSPGAVAFVGVADICAKIKVRMVQVQNRSVQQLLGYSAKDPMGCDQVRSRTREEGERESVARLRKSEEQTVAWSSVPVVRHAFTANKFKKIGRASCRERVS